MKRSELPFSNLGPNFIGSWTLDPSICDGIIDHFEKNQQKQAQGVTGGGLLNIEVKNSRDISLTPKEINLPNNEIYKIYFENLFECYKDYNIQWPFLGSLIKEVNIGSFNVQRYLPGQHFQRIHCERTGIDSLHRLLAFMTYLNDVEEGGSTYFNHYDLDVKPRKGLTLIWPAEWTHSHKGNVLKGGKKYIITGWLTF
jgi:prolyl 4-hydroxylase